MHHRSQKPCTHALVADHVDGKAIATSSTVDERHGYAIAELLQGLIEAARLSDSDFVRVLGYNNVNKGLRRLESWRQFGTGDADFLKRVAEQFAVSRIELEQSLIRTIEQLSDR